MTFGSCFRCSLLQNNVVAAIVFDYWHHLIFFNFSGHYWNLFLCWNVLNCLHSVWDAIFAVFSWIEVAWNVSLHHGAPCPVLELLLTFWSASLHSGTPPCTLKCKERFQNTRRDSRMQKWNEMKSIFFLDLLWMFGISTSLFPLDLLGMLAAYCSQG